jgi:hypothetical protein
LLTLISGAKYTKIKRDTMGAEILASGTVRETISVSGASRSLTDNVRVVSPLKTCSARPFVPIAGNLPGEEDGADQNRIRRVGYNQR